jgi:hypothetical protein
MQLPRRNHRIKLAAAAQMTRRFREQAADQEKGGAFHAEPVRRLLEQDGCTALRYYHGLTPNGSYAPVLVGVDGDGNDIARGIKLDLSIPCPPFCGVWNELNSTVAGSRQHRSVALPLPPRNHHITLEAGAELTRRWRAAHPASAKAGAFDAEQVLELLAQPTCVALRYYRALDEAGKPAWVLVGADVEGADLTAGPVLDLSIPCPPFCGEPNELSDGIFASRAVSVRRRAMVPVGA